MSSPEKNVLGSSLMACSYAPLTGYFRDGWCATREEHGVAHLVCVKTTKEFLDFSRTKGNDLSTPRPELRFRGLQPGDRWCLHVLRWVEAWEAGKAPQVALKATHENVLKLVRPAGTVPVTGRSRRADLLDAAFLGGTAAHGIELDDGYRHGSAHCGCVVIPAVIPMAADRKASGAQLIEAIVCGYETNIALARACAPDLRHRGFHPTSAVGPFGAAMATGKLRGLNAQQLANALGLAASSSAGLFAFVAGGGDVKRLHAHAETDALADLLKKKN